jgi:hypothetical protein
VQYPRRNKRLSVHDTNLTASTSTMRKFESVLPSSNINHHAVRYMQATRIVRRRCCLRTAYSSGGFVQKMDVTRRLLPVLVMSDVMMRGRCLSHCSVQDTFAACQMLLFCRRARLPCIRYEAGVSPYCPVFLKRRTFGTQSGSPLFFVRALCSGECRRICRQALTWCPRTVVRYGVRAYTLTPLFLAREC